MPRNSFFLFLAFFILVFLSRPALAEAVHGIRAALTLPGATQAETGRFKASVDAVSLQRAFSALSPEERAKIRSIALGSIGDGVEILLVVAGDPREAEGLVQKLSQPLVDVANAIRPGRLQIASYRLAIAAPYSLEQMNFFKNFQLFPSISLLTLLMALLLVLILWLRDKGQGALMVPRIQGVSLLGTLPKGLAELKCDPCLALGAMFQMSVRSAPRGEIAVVSPSGEALVAACIGQALAKADLRVLIVDRFGDKSLLTEIFKASEENKENDEKKRVMDILTIRQDQGKMPLPSNLRENYDWVVHFVPGFIPGKKTIVTLDRAPIGLHLLKARIQAVLNHSQLIGLVLIGLRPPSDTLSRYQLRYNFERLRGLDHGPSEA